MQPTSGGPSGPSFAQNHHACQQKLASGVKNPRLLLLFERRPRGPQEAPKKPSRGPQDERLPRGPQEAPQEAPKRPPRGFPEAIKRLPRCLQEATTQWHTGQSNFGRPWRDTRNVNNPPGLEPKAFRVHEPSDIRILRIKDKGY